MLAQLLAYKYCGVGAGRETEALGNTTLTLQGLDMVFTLNSGAEEVSLTHNFYCSVILSLLSAFARSLEIALQHVSWQGLFPEIVYASRGLAIVARSVVIWFRVLLLIKSIKLLENTTLHVADCRSWCMMKCITHAKYM